MCGILGIIQNNSKKYNKEIDLMIDSLKHRGPDGNGKYFFKNAALGHTRLSIVDLSLGMQPMINKKNKIGVTFNGEIYGYKEIKNKIKNYDYKTDSDTEVILALYNKYGDDFLKYLPGMFSFAVWDDKKEKLICARDRFGEKPFYYAWGKNGEFIFASEIKAILKTKLVEPIISKKSIEHYLKYLCVPKDKTIYENIFSLAPAHKLIYSKRKIKISRYWNLPKNNNNISLEEAKNKLEKLFDEAVRKQMIADVPIGAFLSGGLDSSTTVAFASKYKKGIKTFSLGLGDSINEMPAAKEVAKKYETIHKEYMVKKADVSDLILQMNKIYDNPFADSSNIPTYIISKLAKKEVKVALSGDGGDELLGGYGIYKSLLQMNNPVSKLFNFNLKMSGDFFKLILKICNKLKIKTNFLEGIIYFIKYKNLQEAHKWETSFFTKKELSKLLKFKLQKKNYSNGKLNLDIALRDDLENYLPADILTKTDRASMANALELRTPYLDVDFASFCISLAPKYKVSIKKDKILMRKVFSKYWPDSIKKNKKQGFGGPVKEWLSSNEMKSLKLKYLKNSKNKIFTFLNYNKVQKYYNKNNYKTWILLNLSIWMELHDFKIK